jgi:hypothetical protein
MKTLLPYDPEDIESLMLHKGFGDLYPEEREFVLKHVESAEEYESMRRILLELSQTPDNRMERPDASLKDELMHLFAREKRGRFILWLNSLVMSFQGDRVIWYRRPAVQVAFGTILILAGIWWFMEPRTDARLAEHRTMRPPGELSPGPSNPLPSAQEASRIPEAPKANEVISADADSREEEEPHPGGLQDAAALSEASSITKEQVREEKFQASDIIRPDLSPATEQAAKTPAAKAVSASREIGTSASLKAVSGLLDVLYTAR